MTNDATRTRPARAPRKAAPRKAAAPARARTTTGKATTEPLAIEGEIVGTGRTQERPKVPSITWRGRTMPVRLPTGDQISVVLDTYHDLSNASAAETQAAREGDEESAAGQRVGRLMRRALRGALIVLAAEEDREWIKDEMLDGRILLNEVVGLFPLALAQFNGGRAADAGPPPKARRRA